MDSSTRSMPQVASRTTRLKKFFELIKFEHSLFALPFAYLGMVLASQGLPKLDTFIWVTLTMVSGRTFGMTVNRLVDREIDAKNPRTKDSPLVGGSLTTQFAWMAAFVSFALFLIAISFLPRICFYLSPLAILAMIFYPYCKRFTWLSHLFLGLILSMAPVGSWLAVTGSFALTPLLLAGGVMLWVAGFDIIYSLQDYHFDRKENLYSMPAEWGRAKAIQISRFLHFVSVILFTAILISLSSGIWAWAGLLLAAALILHEHRILSEYGLKKLGSAFFTANAWVSVLFFLGLSCDLVLK